MAGVATGFERLLVDYDIDALDRSDDVAIGLWGDLSIAYLNRAYGEFAARNGGEPAISTRWGLGASIVRAIAEPLRDYYRTAFLRCLDGAVWEHGYECSSAEVFRLLRLTAYPLAGGEGLLVVHAARVERPYEPGERPAFPADPDPYADADGLVTQCGHCRRFRRRDGSGSWDWVPVWVAEPPERVSHGLCPPCLGHYYPLASLPPVS